ncbi:hypothetical protein [Enterococcus phage VPE25]|nr:hypothetical protein [Enterococcus phage VPE25]SCZ84017.1 hypothetical protein [Enterococcus phage VFW]
MEQDNKEVIEELQKIINKLYSEEIYAIAFLQGAISGTLQSIKILDNLTDEQLEVTRNNIFTDEILENKWNEISDKYQLELRPFSKIAKIIGK